MHGTISRRNFLGLCALSGIGLALAPKFLLGGEDEFTLIKKSDDSYVLDDLMKFGGRIRHDIFSSPPDTELKRKLAEEECMRPSILYSFTVSQKNEEQARRQEPVQKKGRKKSKKWSVQENQAAEKVCKTEVSLYSSASCEIIHQSGYVLTTFEGVEGLLSAELSTQVFSLGESLRTFDPDSDFPRFIKNPNPEKREAKLMLFEPVSGMRRIAEVLAYSEKYNLALCRIHGIGKTLGIRPHFITKTGIPPISAGIYWAEGYHNMEEMAKYALDRDEMHKLLCGKGIPSALEPVNLEEKRGEGYLKLAFQSDFVRTRKDYGSQHGVFVVEGTETIDDAAIGCPVFSKRDDIAGVVDRYKRCASLENVCDQSMVLVGCIAPQTIRKFLTSYIAACRQ